MQSLLLPHLSYAKMVELRWESFRNIWSEGQKISIAKFTWLQEKTNAHSEIQAVHWKL